MFVHPMWDPIIVTIFGFGIRWYGLAYLFSVLVLVHLGKQKIKRKELTLTLKEFDNLITNIILGIIIGGRLGYMLFYQTNTFWHNPLEILKIWQGGMSFHGGMFGVLSAILISTRKNKQFWSVTDFICQYAPIGLALGRLANFVNGELCGRVSKPYFWSIIYPWLDQSPRHPSQLYEMLSEGLVLFVILRLIARNTQKVGIVSGCFCLLYGCMRFMLEFLREPDVQLGFIWHEWLTMGQLLSIPLIVVGVLLIIFRRRSSE